MNVDLNLKKDKLVFNSVLIGMMLSCNILSVLFSFIPNGIGILIFVPFFFLCLNNFKISINRVIFGEFIVLLNFFLVFFLYSLLIGRYNEISIKYILEFIVLGLPFIIVSHFNFNPKITLQTIVLLSVISLPFYLLNINVDIVSYATDGEALMLISYNLVKMIVPALLLLFIERNFIVLSVTVITIVLSGILLFSFGARGAILCVIITIACSFIYVKNKPINFFSLKFILVLFVVLIIALYFMDIINGISDLFIRYNIQSIALERIAFSLENNSDLSSGRGEIYEIAFAGFSNSPIFGNGIGSFDNYSGNYPHNLFLQQLYEGGFLWGVPMIFIVIFSFVKLNSNMDKQFRYFLIYLITTSIVHLLVSSYFWSSSIYWFLMGLVFHDLANCRIFGNKVK